MGPEGIGVPRDRALTGFKACGPDHSEKLGRGWGRQRNSGGPGLGRRTRPDPRPATLRCRRVPFAGQGAGVWADRPGRTRPRHRRHGSWSSHGTVRLAVIQGHRVGGPEHDSGRHALVVQCTTASPMSSRSVHGAQTWLMPCLIAILWSRDLARRDRGEGATRPDAAPCQPPYVLVNESPAAPYRVNASPSGFSWLSNPRRTMSSAEPAGSPLRNLRRNSRATSPARTS